MEEVDSPYGLTALLVLVACTAAIVVLAWQGFEWWVELTVAVIAIVLCSLLLYFERIEREEYEKENDASTHD